MKWAVTCVVIALFVFALPTAILADHGTDQTAKQEDSAQTEDSENIVDKITDAVADLLGLDDDDTEEPLENVHPPDWDPPEDGPEGDDGGWGDTNR